MRAADRVSLGALVQSILGELSDGFEHLDSCLIARPLRFTDKALVDQRLDSVEIGPTNIRYGIDRSATGEYREAVEQPPVGLHQEVVAPRDRGVQRTLTLGRVPGSAGQ